MNKEEHNKIIDFVNSDDYMLLAKRLNNIIDELEKWLKDYINLLDKPDVYEEQTLEDLKEALDKLKELKGE